MPLGYGKVKSNLVKSYLLSFVLLARWNMRFIGRNAALQHLSRFLDRSLDTLAVVYGRRRVGKSELLRQALKLSGLQ